MRWANNRVRVTYLSKALGGDPDDKDFQKFNGAGGNLTSDQFKDFDEDNEKDWAKLENQAYTNITFDASSQYNQYLKFKFDKIFDGMRSKFCVFHSKNYKNSTVFDNWKFKTTNEFDNFWFDQINSTLLLHSMDFTIGKENVQVASIRVTPEIKIQKDFVTKSSVLGIPTSYGDKETKLALYDKTRNYNIDARTPLHDIDDSDDYKDPFEFKIGFEVDFVERIYRFKYYNAGDVLSAIGGLNAFINPILKWLVIAFIISFLMQLSLELKTKNEKAYQVEVRRFLTYATE